MKQIKTGKIVRVSPQTLRVEVRRGAIHPLYHKKYIVTKTYLVQANDETQYQIGQIVSFTATRKQSKRKSWIIQ